MPSHSKGISAHLRGNFFRMTLLMLSLDPIVGAIAAEESPVTLKLASPAFAESGAIPRKYTCKGHDVSPPLAWSGVPQNAKSLVLIVDDPDAPDPAAPKTTWVHWVLYNLPPSSTGLPEGVTSETLPAGAMAGLNDWKRASYGGPCPPIGRHRYFHKLYALDASLDALDQPDKADIEAKMRPHILAEATLIGTYKKGLGFLSKLIGTFAGVFFVATGAAVALWGWRVLGGGEVAHRFRYRCLFFLRPIVRFGIALT